MTTLEQPVILGIESSCDDTSAAVVRGTQLLSTVIASQKVHELWGGVVPELASRAHQQNIVPVVDAAIRQANIRKEDITAIAFTRGPGLMGSLLVGTSFAKSLSVALGVPLIEVNHMQGHILANFVDDGSGRPVPHFPFLCLTVSGGHTQIVRVDDYLEQTVLGSTIDDAAGEAFDKIGKMLSLPYPAGPHIDRLAREGDPKAFSFSRPEPGGLDFSFSGLKTSFLYMLRDARKRKRKTPISSGNTWPTFVLQYKGRSWTYWSPNSCGPSGRPASARQPSPEAFRPTRACARLCSRPLPVRGSSCTFRPSSLLRTMPR